MNEFRASRHLLLRNLLVGLGLLAGTVVLFVSAWKRWGWRFGYLILLYPPMRLIIEAVWLLVRDPVLLRIDRLGVILSKGGRMFWKEIEEVREEDRFLWGRLKMSYVAITVKNVDQVLSRLGWLRRAWVKLGSLGYPTPFRVHLNMLNASTDMVLAGIKDGLRTFEQAPEGSELP